MTHDDFFYVLPQNIHGNNVSLEERESSHLIKVMRCKKNDLFWAIDGNGFVYECKITIADKKKTIADIVRKLADFGEPTFQITVAVGIPKKHKFEWILEKGTELGVSAFTPLRTKRTTANEKSIKYDRLNNIIISSCKQCKRSKFPTLGSVQSFKYFCEHSGQFDIKFIAHEKTTTSTIDNLLRASTKPPEIRSVCLCVGPEGGFTEEEVQFAVKNGFQPITFGVRRLRTETAAIVGATIILNTLGELQ